MRKGRDGGKTGKKKREKTDENSGHYVIASSRPPERRPLERRTLAPKTGGKKEHTDENSGHYVIASSRPTEHRPLAPILGTICVEDELFCSPRTITFSVVHMQPL